MNLNEEMSKQAFTLIEVVISAAIMAIALTMIIATVVMLQGTAYSASNRLEALQEARSQMEMLMSLSYGNTALTVGAHSFVSPSGTFTGSYTVATNASLPNLKNISLTIYWLNPGASSVSSNTIIGARTSALD